MQATVFTATRGQLWEVSEAEYLLFLCDNVCHSELTDLQVSEQFSCFLLPYSLRVLVLQMNGTSSRLHSLIN